MIVTTIFVSLFFVCVSAQETTTPPPIVPVLLQLDNETRSKIETILINQNLPQIDVNAQVDAIFAQQSPSIAVSLFSHP